MVRIKNIKGNWYLLSYSPNFESDNKYIVGFKILTEKGKEVIVDNFPKGIPFSERPIKVIYIVEYKKPNKVYNKYNEEVDKVWYFNELKKKEQYWNEEEYEYIYPSWEIEKYFKELEHEYKVEYKKIIDEIEDNNIVQLDEVKSISVDEEGYIKVDIPEVLSLNLNKNMLGIYKRGKFVRDKIKEIIRDEFNLNVNDDRVLKIDNYNYCIKFLGEYVFGYSEIDKYFYKDYKINELVNKEVKGIIFELLEMKKEDEKEIRCRLNKIYKKKFEPQRLAKDILKYLDIDVLIEKIKGLNVYKNEQEKKEDLVKMLEDVREKVKKFLEK